jgi:putative glycosyltransferase
MKLSIVTTLYNSAPYINEFYNRIIASTKKITDDYEVIFVNDGSSDNSLQIAITLFHKKKNIKIIDLSRNFGQHKAIMTGLGYASGDYIFLVDIDLEEPPELLNLFWERMSDSDTPDVVYGVQESRKGEWFEKISGNLFYYMIKKISNTEIPRNLIITRLMTRLFVENLISFRESELAFAGICTLTGFKQVGQPIKKHHKGTTSYNFTRKLDMAINFIVNFSNKPLIMISIFGILVTLISLFLIVYFLIHWSITSNPVTGWTTLMLSSWLLGGITMLCLGIVSIYLSKIFIEVKRRPYTIIKHVYKRKKPI